MKESPATILARRIANRDTELHRAFDAYAKQYHDAQNAQRQATKELMQANDNAASARAGMASCRTRATAQGYPTLFTL